jgi:hypothetical protein
MRLTHCAAMAQHREHGLQRQGKDDMALRTQKGHTFRMKCRKGPECKIGIKDPGTRWQQHHKIVRMSERINRKAFGLEFVKRARGMSSGVWRIRKCTLWRGLSPPKRKKTLCME